MAADIYEPCDRAVRELDRSALKAFGALKLARFDEMHIIRDVQKTYRNAAKEAEKRLREVAEEAYILALLLCGVDDSKARRMAKNAIKADFVRDILADTDPVTMYRFDTETERKAQRLVEMLSAIAAREAMPGRPATNRNAEIDRALKAWAKQVGQYAITVTDHAVVQAFEDAGIEGAWWVSERDNRVCAECHKLDGKWFPLQEIPIKPHWGCRCRLIPGGQEEVSTGEA